MPDPMPPNSCQSPTGYARQCSPPTRPRPSPDAKAKGHEMRPAAGMLRTGEIDRVQSSGLELTRKRCAERLQQRLHDPQLRAELMQQDQSGASSGQKSEGGFTATAGATPNRMRSPSPVQHSMLPTRMSLTPPRARGEGSVPSARPPSAGEQNLRFTSPSPLRSSSVPRSQTSHGSSFTTQSSPRAQLRYPVRNRDENSSSKLTTSRHAAAASKDVSTGPRNSDVDAVSAAPGVKSPRVFHGDARCGRIRPGEWEVDENLVHLGNAAELASCHLKRSISTTAVGANSSFSSNASSTSTKVGMDRRAGVGKTPPTGLANGRTPPRPPPSARPGSTMASVPQSALNRLSPQRLRLGNATDVVEDKHGSCRPASQQRSMTKKASAEGQLNAETQPATASSCLENPMVRSSSSKCTQHFDIAAAPCKPTSPQVKAPGHMSKEPGHCSKDPKFQRFQEVAKSLETAATVIRQVLDQTSENYKATTVEQVSPFQTSSRKPTPLRKKVEALRGDTGGPDSYRSSTASCASMSRQDTIAHSSRSALERENAELRSALNDAARRLAEVEGEKDQFMSEGVFDLVNSLCLKANPPVVGVA